MIFPTGQRCGLLKGHVQGYTSTSRTETRAPLSIRRLAPLCCSTAFLESVSHGGAEPFGEHLVGPLSGRASLAI